MQRLRVEWSGPAVVGSGISTFYGDEGAGSLDPAEFVTFFDTIKNVIAPGVVWTVPNGGDQLNETTGELAGTWSGSGGGTVGSTGSGNFAVGVGARVAWGTGGIVNGRRVRGSTFLVPIAANSYDAQGTISSGSLSSIQTAADGLISGLTGALVIWSRPVPGRAGSMHEVLSAAAPDRVSWLRSRRT